MSEVVHVGLYGGKSIFGKGREQPLVADVISCKCPSECSFLKQDSCLLVRTFGGGYCPFGSIDRHQGYTSRAQKYWSFRSKYEKHERYNKLEHPKKRMGVIKNQVVLMYSHMQVIKDEITGRYKVDQSMIGGFNISFVPYESFTSDLIHEIVTFAPRTWFGDKIMSYREEQVPLFLAHLEEVLPERYKEFTNAYPQYRQKNSYIGRKALLRTLNPSVVQYKSDRYPEFNEDWYWDGETLCYQQGYIKAPNIVKKFEVLEFRIRPAEDTVIVITDDSQVGTATIFVD